MDAIAKWKSMQLQTIVIPLSMQVYFGMIFLWTMYDTYKPIPSPTHSRPEAHDLRQNTIGFRHVYNRGISGFV